MTFVRPTHATMEPRMAEAIRQSPWCDIIERQAPLSLCGSGLIRPCDGVLVGIGGIMPMWPGVGHAWTIIHPSRTRREMMTLHNCAMGQLVRASAEYGLVRIQCDVKADFGPGIRWLERLGFTAEGTMRRYNPDGSDAIMYALITET